MLQGDLFKLLETTADAAYATTETGEIRSGNTAAQKLFGYPSSEALNRICSDLFQGRGVLGTMVRPTRSQRKQLITPTAAFGCNQRIR